VRAGAGPRPTPAAAQRAARPLALAFVVSFALRVGPPETLGVPGARTC
jgi:hypothetical protein